MKAMIPPKARNRHQEKSGQAILEYVITGIVIAIAAIAIISSFSGTVQNLWGGATEQLGGDGSARTDGQELLQQLGGGTEERSGGAGRTAIVEPCGC